MISFHSAGVSFPDPGGTGPDSVLLEPASLDLTEPRIAVIGANGSGKSTFLRLINGLARPTTGRIAVQGLDTVRDVAAVRRRVGFLFSDPLSQLVMPLVREDVELSLKASVKNKARRREAALHHLGTMGLAHLSERSVHDLSGGERQLVALTSVLATGQGILVADEPTTLLDLRNNVLLQDTLFGLDQQVIYATHDLDFAARADRTLVIDAGRIIHDGDPRDAVDCYRRLALDPQRGRR
ncbi:energy-coupling factor ABC transporter ATP-binding protein [Arthrobacter sp. JSM 101049]|uniref:energy-coupling factor ABC transporter ATP-binding protein n=1 Tax=Arthrobacter sp. JSM 101049 TaxID=929097 RepID=UPI0035640DD8